eukprot:tig00001467_g8771.t1
MQKPPLSNGEPHVVDDRGTGTPPHRRPPGRGQKRIDAQHAKGKLTARERIEVLLDEGFEELDMYVEHNCVDFGMHDRCPGDGVVTGSGTINGRLVFVFSQDFTVLAVLSERTREDLQDHGHGDEGRRAVIGLNDSGGARIQEGVARSRLCEFSSATCWLGRGAADQLIMGHRHQRGVTQEELGGAITTPQVGRRDVAFENDIEALLQCATSSTSCRSTRKCPSGRATTLGPAGTSLDTLIPAANQPYDMHELIRKTVTRAILRVQPAMRQHPVGFGRIEGDGGIVANQPMVLAGVLDINSSKKAARFVRFCDAFESRSYLCRRAGFLPARPGAYGIIKHGAKLLFAYARRRAEDHRHHPQGLWRRL